eukprot:jgi/Tetstr1/425375/TSEL_015822.t1
MSVAKAALLAVQHVNSGDCQVLGPGCDKPLFSDDGTRVHLNPKLINVQSWAPSDAPPAAKACIETGAEFVVGSTTSEQSNLVAAFIGGFGHLMLSSGSESPALSKKELYHNFARTAVNAGWYMRGLVDVAFEFGWKQMAVLHNQDLYGIDTAQILELEARERGVTVDPMQLGTLRAHEVQAAVRELVDSGDKIVCLLVFKSEVKRILKIAKEYIDAAGVDYSTFTWIVGSSDTTYAVSASGVDADKPGAEDLALFQGLLGIQVQLNKEARQRLQTSMRGSFSDAASLLPVVEEMMNSAGLELPNVDMTEVDTMLETVDSFPEINKHPVHMYDAVWAMAMWIAAGSGYTSSNLSDVKGVDVMNMLKSGGAPGFNGAAGRRNFLPTGDWDLTEHRLEITNYGVPEGGSAPRHAVVGWVQCSDGKITLSTEERIVWSNGRDYPFIPHDGSPPPVQRLLIYGVASAMALLILVVAILAWRTARLARRVQALTSLDDLDLDSPLAKVMNFLERLQSRRRADQPSPREVRELQEFIVRNSQALTRPDLETGLTNFDPALKRFLQWGQVRDDSDSSGNFNDSSDTASLHGAKRSSRSVSSSAASYGDLVMLEDAELARNIAEDFLLDVISPESRFHGSTMPLSAVVSHSAHKLRLLGQKKSAFDKLMAFTSLVEAGYPETGYHCKAHGADVTNRMMTIVHTLGLTSITPGHGEVSLGLVSLVAAMVHDFGHPQVNNAFLIDQEKPMAADFNNQAVAENFALREALRALMQPEMNFIDELCKGSSHTATKRKWFKRMVIDTVLATNMSRHYDLLSQFKVQVVQNTKLRALGSTADKWREMSDSQRLLVLQMAMKVADLGHCALPLKIHKIWVDRLEQEFFAQGDLERAAGRKVSPLMDRTLPGPNAPSNQAGFMKVMIMPLFSAWTEVFPECSPLMDQLRQNYDHWQKLSIRTA